MFRHRSVIFREAMNTKGPKSNAACQALIALTVIFKMLKENKYIIK
jgi:hypothetical protein